MLCLSDAWTCRLLCNHFKRHGAHPSPKASQRKRIDSLSFTLSPPQKDHYCFHQTILELHVVEVRSVFATVQNYSRSVSAAVTDVGMCICNLNHQSPNLYLQS